jgi:hypothetical protein
MSFDIIIPLGPNELSRIDTQIKYTKQNVIGYRNIYIITCNKNIQINGCIMIDENIFPFKQFISQYFGEYNGKNNRNGWYFQQLIKLYSWYYIPDILDNYLVIDADVFFLKPTQFIVNDKFIYSVGNEYHIPYFKHMNLLHNSFKKEISKSGICHHMIFNKQYLKNLFEMVETFHNNNKPFWQIFILSVKEHFQHPPNFSESGASEYELYINYMIRNNMDRIMFRNLNWQNISPTDFVSNRYNHNYDFVSVCSWLYP